MLIPERAQLEALLFATDTPLTLNRIAELLVMPVGRVDRELELLEEQYRNEGHALFVAREGNSVRLRTRPEYAQLLIAVRGEPARLTRPALEVLAIIAMQKNVTRSEVDRLRGVDSDSVVNGLVARGLIEEAGREESAGRAAYFRVTDLFLELFGVTSVKDLQEEFINSHSPNSDTESTTTEVSEVPEAIVETAPEESTIPAEPVTEETETPPIPDPEIPS